MSERDIIVVALGGNAILKPGQKGTVDEQVDNIRASCGPIIDLVRQGYGIVLTHGNGPQVGNDLLRSEAAAALMEPEPLEVCVANTQGSMGYLVTQALGNMLAQAGLPRRIVAVLTQVEVGEHDPAFQAPEKPIGPFYSKERAAQIKARQQLVMKEDSGRGYRRLVPSPEPLAIVEKEAIAGLVRSGFIVLAAGGGGVPVIRRDGQLTGVAAVIDKDRSSALLATEIGASRLLILTGVDHVKLSFGQPGEKAIRRMTVSEARQYLAAGEFAPGSMGPKIEAAISFLCSGGQEVIITSLPEAAAALKGELGTVLVADPN